MQFRHLRGMHGKIFKAIDAAICNFFLPSTITRAANPKSAQALKRFGQSSLRSQRCNNENISA